MLYNSTLLYNKIQSPLPIHNTYFFISYSTAFANCSIMHHRLIHTSKNGRLHSRQLFHDMFTGGFSHMDKESKQPGIVAYM